MYAATSALAAPCESLSALKLPHTTIVSVNAVAAGQLKLPPDAAPPNAPLDVSTLPSFCRVTAVSRPSADSEIALEVWLPTATWNTQLQPVGNGLWGGSINYAGLIGMVRAGYATASNDTGHRGAGASFALGHPEKVTDFGYRAFHEMMLLANAAIDRFYQRRPSLSFVDQCGGAGRGALAEIQRHPDAFDVIAAAGLDTETTRHSLGQLWVWQATHRSPESAIPATKFPLLHRAALDACDANDGIADGIIANPRACTVDPSILRCKAGDALDCLTDAQVETARQIYSPVVNPRTQDVLFGPLMPGGELAWGQQTGPEPFPYGTDFMRYLVMKDAAWHPRARPVDFDRDAAAADAVQNRIVNVEPNVNKYLERGGKLLFVGGWADGAIAPASNTNFYERVVRNAGPRAAGSVRLFMVPDMGHCPSPATAANGYVVDTAGIVDAWRRTGKAPDSIVVTRRVNGADERKMLVCRYPQSAVYKGSGDPKLAESFTCR
jgi:feruloyl esterase